MAPDAARAGEDVTATEREPCPRCNGNGRVEMLEHCPRCRGNGYLVPCPDCGVMGCVTAHDLTLPLPEERDLDRESMDSAAEATDG